MIDGKINIDKNVIHFNLSTSTEDVYQDQSTTMLFNELIKPGIKMSTCLSLMANLFALIEKKELRHEQSLVRD